MWPGATGGVGGGYPGFTLIRGEGRMTFWGRGQRKIESLCCLGLNLLVILYILKLCQLTEGREQV